MSMVRIEETAGQILALGNEFQTWLDHRTKRDTLQQYRTQLTTIETVFGVVLKRLGAEVAAIRTDQPTGSVYQQCRDNDRRTVAVRRFWGYFRDKFDQRDDPRLRGILAAADEMCWSCWVEAFRASNQQPGPAPLPYIDARFSANATPRVTPPPDLQVAGDEVLRDHLSQLPVPVIALPPVCIDRPWWLIFLAHETGHHVQYDLDGKLVARTANILGRFDPDESYDDEPADGPTWRGWGRQIFADAYSVLIAGPWAMWAMSELETGEDKALLTPFAQYPPPLVRAALMEAVLATQGLPTPAEARSPTMGRPIETLRLGAGDEHLRARATQLLASVPEVALALTTDDLGENRSLPALCGWNAGRFGRKGQVKGWCTSLLSADEPIPQKSDMGARLCVAGGVEAWESVVRTSTENDIEGREQARSQLCRRILATVPECRANTVRAAVEPPRQNFKRIGSSLADALLAVDPARLG